MALVLLLGVANFMVTTTLTCLTLTGGLIVVDKICSESPSEVVINAHKLFPFDKKPCFSSNLEREAKEACLSGYLFYPGLPHELIDFLHKQLKWRGSPFRDHQIVFKTTKLGLIETIRVIWNNRMVYDVYVDNKFIRQATCFAVSMEEFVSPSSKVVYSFLALFGRGVKYEDLHRTIKL
jgi:hypothetical protein